MTQDEIIDMATKVYGECDWHESALHHLEAFAKLVSEKEREREACAMLCLWHHNKMSQPPTLFHMAELIRARGQE